METACQAHERERATAMGSGAAQNGWVLMPLWDGDPDHHRHRGGGRTARRRRLEAGCEFSLELPRGGHHAIAQDLEVLPLTLPPLLGRTAQIGLRRRRSASASPPSGGVELPPFELQWGRRSLRVQLRAGDSSRVGDSNISGRAETVLVHCADEGEQRWVFVSRSFRQGAEAIQAFTQHTRKVYPPDQNEELCVFFELDSRGCPKPPAVQAAASSRRGSGSRGRGLSAPRASRSGLIHSTLPTKLQVPMGCHVQSSWLLSIDRMDVQALTDNAWNAGLLSQMGRVCVLLLRWIADTHTGELSFSKARFTILPRMSRDSMGSLVTELLETAVDCSIVEKACRNERLVPILAVRTDPVNMAIGSESAAKAPAATTTTTCVKFVRSTQAILVPSRYKHHKPPAQIARAAASGVICLLVCVCVPIASSRLDSPRKSWSLGLACHRSRHQPWAASRLLRCGTACHSWMPEQCDPARHTSRGCWVASALTPPAQQRQWLCWQRLRTKLLRWKRTRTTQKMRRRASCHLSSSGRCF
jgi:hypothetical protein